MAELEDDILCFLPTVSDLDVFGCELDLLDLHTQQPLPEAFHTVLQRPQLQIVVRPCVADGHSIWQFQKDGKESYPKAVRVPANPRGEIADRAFHAAPSLRHVEVATGIQHVGIAAWQSCQQLQIVLKQSATVARMRSNSYKMLCESECGDSRRAKVLACSADPRGDGSSLKVNSARLIHPWKRYCPNLASLLNLFATPSDAITHCKEQHSAKALYPKSRQPGAKTLFSSLQSPKTLSEMPTTVAGSLTMRSCRQFLPSLCSNEPGA